MKKIKLTELQLNKLHKRLQEEYMQMDELGSEEYSYDGDKFRRGKSKAPSPYEMAKTVIDNIKLHPAYYEDREKMYAFLDAITNMLVDEVEAGGLKKRNYDDEMLDITPQKLNEQPVASTNQTVQQPNQNQPQASKTMQQINKTYPVPPPQPEPIQKKEEKRGPNVDSPELLADKENFKSYFPGKNIENFRVPLYKYVYANKNNPQLSAKLLKLLYKS
jgi:hypothetical protein